VMTASSTYWPVLWRSGVAAHPTIAVNAIAAISVVAILRFFILRFLICNLNYLFGIPLLQTAGKKTLLALLRHA
jgi:hypothetical protein